MNSILSSVLPAPEDPIIRVYYASRDDPSPVKLNLSIGAYRTEEGKPLLLEVVRRAEQELANDKCRDKEYPPLDGLADFNKLSAKLVLGDDSSAVKEKRVVTIQCLSGTGALRVGAEFLAKNHQQSVILVPNPTWSNHPPLFTLAGLSVEYFRYYDPKTRGIDFQGLLEDLGAAPSGAIVVLQACAHNPTGVDPTLEQWEQIRQVVRSKRLLPFFDSAYQGFASGSLDRDAQVIRMFVDDGGECLIAQSFAKNMGLYAERIGALTIVCESEDVARKVQSQVILIVRYMYLCPPTHGASIVTTILKNSDMYNDWTIELKGMADRIISMRQQLFEAIQARGTPGDWSHIIKQIGMFSFTGLNEKHVRLMAKEYHIYMTDDGRISMAGLSPKTIPQLADAIHAVIFAYRDDPSPVKLNLSAGAYRTEEGKPLVLEVVRRAEQQLANDLSRDKEYPPLDGLAEFNKLSAKLVLGDYSPAMEEHRVVTIQCLSGTGSLRVGAEFLAKNHQQSVIFVPNPTWGNHIPIFTLAGLSVEYFRYYDPKTRGIDFQGLLEDLGAAPSGAIVVLQACAHNPTGVDPTLEQWEQIRQIVRSKRLLPFFDSAYQGFASGSLDSDAQVVRMFVDDGGECLIAQSFAKNMGLYAERIGALTIVCESEEVARKVHSQVLLVVRPMYLCPPTHGASIVTTILKNSDMYNDWTIELKAMADRIIRMRRQLYEAIQARGTPGDWSHIIKQIGMFSFTGLNEKHVRLMAKEYHIYMTYDGRISMASLSSKTIPQLADAIHAVVTCVG
ncbi:unnamed protein product [Microthlaspi erraticum]|uniref:Aspartate aminotransferase n=1 Tax=Microthlaspi erraticum TaxID=1685480 RepID=A0A6D2IZW4_9BRAS|nr:unnamed protein product [Microthlaspi erraticum]